MRLVLQSLYFMLPAYMANMAPVIFKWLPWGAFPIKKRIFGSHKTVRGFVSGVITAIIVVLFQKKIPWEEISILRYETFSVPQTVLIGFLFGIGSLGGDLLKSFFKRRMRIAEGKPWVPFDQLDFVIGALLLVSIVYRPPWTYIVIILVLTPLLHLITNVIAYVLRLKRVWW